MKVCLLMDLDLSHGEIMGLMNGIRNIEKPGNSQWRVFGNNRGWWRKILGDEECWPELA